MCWWCSPAIPGIKLVQELYILAAIGYQYSNGYLTQPLVTWPSHRLLDPAIGYLTQPSITWPSHRLLDPAIGYLTQPSSTWNSHSGLILQSTETHGQWILYLSHQITKLELFKQGQWIFRPADFMTSKIWIHSTRPGVTFYICWAVPFYFICSSVTWAHNNSALLYNFNAIFNFYYFWVFFKNND